MFYLLRQPKGESAAFARALLALGEQVEICKRCGTYAESELCPICADLQRDGRLLCVVEEARDIATLESTGLYRGRYHVLGGTLNPLEGMTADALRIRELEARLATEPEISEIILALSPTSSGETTMLLLAKRLQPAGKKITRLARGLPTGASLEYADEVTLGDALTGRREA